MTKQKIISAVIFVLITSLSISLTAQSDAKAKALLDKVSAKTKSYSSIKADFNYTLENKAEGINETQSGSIAIKGDKYALKIAGQEIKCDGNTIWTYLKDAEEVQITEVDEDNEDVITPTRIFTMYEKGFRFKYVKDDMMDGVNIALVDIYPTDVDDKSYHTVKLYIDKGQLQFKRIEIKGKEGDTYTYKIKSFIPNAAMNESDFTFNKANYPGVEMVDLR